VKFLAATFEHVYKMRRMKKKKKKNRRRGRRRKRRNKKKRNKTESSTTEVGWLGEGAARREGKKPADW